MGLCKAKRAVLPGPPVCIFTCGKVLSLKAPGHKKENAVDGCHGGMLFKSPPRDSTSESMLDIVKYK